MVARVLLFLVFVYIGGNMYLTWSRESNYKYVLPKYGDLQVTTGTLELNRPWKLSPYLRLRANDRDVLLYCFGPYERNYWCDALERAGFEPGGRYTVRWHPWGKNDQNFVFEISNDSDVLLGYEKQCDLFLSSLDKGLSYGQLVAAAAMFFLAIGAISGIRKG